MKLAAVFALAVCALGAALPAQATDAPLAAPIEACIRGNAVKVSAAIPDLNQAVDFLVDKLCAKPIADAAAAEQRAVMDSYADAQRKRCDEWKKNHASTPAASGDPDDMNPCAMAESMSAYVGVTAYSVSLSRSMPAPPEATALAARLLLDLRLAHENPPGR